MRQILARAGESDLVRVWNLPETGQVRTQLLDKLAAVPWPFLRGSGTNTKASALIRPLLDDVLQEEFYFEGRQVTNQTETAETAFAIRLDESKAAQWETRLASALESLTGLHPAASSGRKGWLLQKHDPPNRIEFARVGGWIVVGTAQDRNGLIDEVLAKIQRDRVPYSGPSSNWLELEIDLPRMGGIYSAKQKLPPTLPRISLSVAGVETNVHTVATADFRREVAFEFESWTMPSNVIHAPVSSFTALRGFRPWLGSLTNIGALQILSVPNQVFGWAEEGSLVHTFFSACVPDATNQLEKIAEFVLENQQGMITTNYNVGFTRATDGNGLDWIGLAFLWPQLKTVSTPGGNFVVGWFFPSAKTDEWPPPELPKNIMERTNLVYYDWEMTGARVESWLYIGQFCRYVLLKNQLPFDSKSLAWLKAIHSKLGKSVTQIYKTGPGQFALDRRSSVGLTGIELNLFADWLEAPDFPFGLNTFAPLTETNQFGSGQPKQH